MRGKLALLTVVAVCCVIPAASAAQHQRQTSTTVNVTTTIYDFTDSTSLTQNLTRSDDYNAAGQSTYSVADGSVTSSVSSLTGFSLDLSSQNTRNVYLTFSSWVSGKVQPLPDGLYNGTAFVRCFDNSGALLNLFALGVNGAYNSCSFHVNITIARTGYVYVMSPTQPGTGWSTVTCTAVNVSGCSAWHVVPNLDTTLPGNVATVSNLYVSSRNGTQTLVGSYHNTYRLDFSQ